MNFPLVESLEPWNYYPSGNIILTVYIEPEIEKSRVAACVPPGICIRQERLVTLTLLGWPTLGM